MELRGVSKRYGLRRPWVVRQVDLALAPGGLVRVGGVNGSGKSTLLRLIAGATDPTRGAVRGRPRTGFVPERFSPALPLTAAAFLAHVGRASPTGRPAISASIPAGCWPRRRRRPSHPGTVSRPWPG